MHIDKHTNETTETTNNAMICFLSGRVELKSNNHDRININLAEHFSSCVHLVDMGIIYSEENSQSIEQNIDF